MLFSLGEGGAPAPVVAGVVVVVVVVVVVSGAFSSFAHAAVIAPIAMTAQRPEIAASRRAEKRESMVRSYLSIYIYVLTWRGRPSGRRGRRPHSLYLLRCTPGGSVGAGGAMTGGVNRLPPVGLMLFSLGAGAGVAGEDVVVGVVVVVVEVSGAFCSSLAQDAVNAPIATIATPPATAASRRAKRDESMLVPIHMAATSRFLTSGRGR